MSVEKKIKELLEGKLTSGTVTEATTGDQTAPRQGSSVEVPAAGVMGAGNVKKDTTKSAKSSTSGDQTQPRQGSSATVTYDSRDGNAEENQGATASKKVKKDDLMKHMGKVGAAPNYTTVADPASVVNQSSSEGVRVQEDTDANDDTLIDDSDDTQDFSDEFKNDLLAVFGDETLSEEFKTKAASLFEAVVTARVNSIVEGAVEQIAEEAEAEIAEYKNELTDQVDAFVNYVAESWINENKIVVEEHLRNEIATSFIEGLKNLFAEHYIEVPEDKYDVLSALQSEIDELKAQQDKLMAANVELHSENVELRKDQIFSAVSEGLAKTESEKFKSLVTDVAFENADLYTEKLNVIKENYFRKDVTVLSGGNIEDESTHSIDRQSNSEMDAIVATLSKIASKK